MNLSMYKDINYRYNTVTTTLTILDSQKDIYDKGMHGFFEYDAIQIKFQTEDGIIFSEKLELFLGPDSVLLQIIHSIGLDNVLGDINPESFIGKSFKAVIAAKKGWEKAFIVAAF